MRETSHSHLQRAVLAALLLALGIGSGACSDNSNNPAAPEPAPEVPTVVVEYTGNIEQLETDCNEFTLADGGDIQMQITDLQPLSTITMGLALGEPDAAQEENCFPFAEDRSVLLLELFTSADLAPGDYCICIFDVGNIFFGESIDYILELTRPE